MDAQIGSGRERFVTLLTRVRFNVRMAQHVLAEPRFLCVRFIALGASKRPFGAVHIAPVGIQHGLRVEGFRTLFARERALGVVRQGVSFK